MRDKNGIPEINITIKAKNNWKQILLANKSKQYYNDIHEKQRLSCCKDCGQAGGQKRNRGDKPCVQAP